MPWQTSTIMSLKAGFIEQCLAKQSSLSSLCRAYGISRNTAYKLLKRFELHGAEALVDLRSRRKTRVRYPPEIWQGISELRKAHPTYGPRKLAQILAVQHPEHQWPSASLIKKYLRDNGLSQPRVFRRGIVSERLPLREFTGPNSIWCMDFKGYFITADNKRCDPLTLLDGSSRYFLACTALRPMRFAQVKPVLEKAFHEYGKPETIRTDNSPPFGSSGFRGLSPLSVWLLKIGIWPEKITPGHPGQNGRLERAHRTLQQDLLNFGLYNYAEYKILFERFIDKYNNLRPHEALNQRVPAQVYERSPRLYVPCQLTEYVYPPDYDILKVNNKGYFRIKGEMIYLTESLASEYIGLAPESEQGRELIFLGYPLGFIEEHYSRLRKPKKKPTL